MNACLLHIVCIIATLSLSVQLVVCQVYSWTNQPGDIYNQPCNSDQLNFTWTYTPASPDPALIQWSKQNAGGTFLTVATFTGGTITPDAAYTGRVVRIGNTAELGLMNLTSVDDGTYRVTVTDNGGQAITSQDVVVSTVIPCTLDASGITATCGAYDKTVTCGGITSLGTPPANLTLSYGSTSKDNGATQTTVSEEMTFPETVTCSISGPATECLGAAMMKSKQVKCGVYSWTNQPGDIYNQPCNSDQLNFTWTYTPASPDPVMIEWRKQNSDGTFDAVARFTGGTVTPGVAYTGRVVRIGNTAELGLMNPTSADDGIYRVTVTDWEGQTMTSQDGVVSTVIPCTLDASGITATCGVNGKIVTCEGIASLGTPPANLTLSYGSTSKDNGATQTTVSEEMTSRETVTCSIFGPATECLGAGVTKSQRVECGVTATLSPRLTSQ